MVKGSAGMQVGIGLPATIPGVSGTDILEWARRADSGPFSSLSIIDRLVYGNYEPLITLATVAGVTQRVHLMPSVLLAPFRSAAILASEAATLDALSGGRLTLGLGVGGREDDYRAAGASFQDRGRRFDEHLATMKRIWAGESMAEDIGSIGPRPVQEGGPPILIGGHSPAAIRRVARWGDGYLATGVDPATARQLYEIALAAWQEAGRPGQPRFVMGLYFALGPDAAERGGTYIRDYYAFLGPMADMIAGAIVSSDEAIKGVMQAYRDVGVDELALWPTIAELDQVDRLAQLIG
jgi:alkanesulfonate monooxygenase SsuD/methylene tetrahydromethanopterin reductase-like flavin-dependent oxidoreductase (luciferase family)